MVVTRSFPIKFVAVLATAASAHTAASMQKIIKPQLEKVLNLPGDSLTKEIKLVQDLLQLFVEYQVPSDLLSFGGAAEAPRAAARASKDVLSMVAGQVAVLWHTCVHSCTEIYGAVHLPHVAAHNPSLVRHLRRVHHVVSSQEAPELPQGPQENPPLPSI